MFCHLLSRPRFTFSAHDHTLVRKLNTLLRTSSRRCLRRCIDSLVHRKFEFRTVEDINLPIQVRRTVLHGDCLECLGILVAFALLKVPGLATGRCLAFKPSIRDRNDDRKGPCARWLKVQNHVRNRFVSDRDTPRDVDCLERFPSIDATSHGSQ